MKLMRQTILTSVLALALGVGAAAHAQIANGTYVFTETDGSSNLTGSWVQISNDQLVAWDIMDPADNDFWKTDNSNISNPDIYEAGVYGPNEWAWNIQANNPDNSGDPLVEIGDVNGAGEIYLNISYTDHIDPSGVWADPVPDGSWSVALLGGTLLGLGIGQLIFRRPVGRRI
jgi:hypothetical protein